MIYCAEFVQVLTIQIMKAWLHNPNLTVMFNEFFTGNGANLDIAYKTVFEHGCKYRQNVNQ